MGYSSEAWPTTRKILDPNAKDLPSRRKAVSWVNHSSDTLVYPTTLKNMQKKEKKSNMPKNEYEEN